jgi:LAO/AO transport system kinase
MEIGDIFVINKAERDGVERTERELISLLEMSQRPDGWTPPIVRTVAIKNQGLEAFSEAIEKFAAFRRTQTASLARRASIAETRLLEILRDQLLRNVLQRVLPPEELHQLAMTIAAKERDPYSIVEEIMARVTVK